MSEETATISRKLKDETRVTKSIQAGLALKANGADLTKVVEYYRNPQETENDEHEATISRMLRGASDEVKEQIFGTLSALYPTTDRIRLDHCGVLTSSVAPHTSAQAPLTTPGEGGCSHQGEER